MKSTLSPVHIGGESGYLFETTFGDGICFVPKTCLRGESRDEVSVDDVTYLVSGWARKNGLLNPYTPGHRLFPNVHAVRGDFETPTVVEFLSRVRHPAWARTPAA